MMGRWTAVTDQLAIILAHGVSPAQRGMGRSWASVSIPNISGVDCKNKQERREGEKDI